MKDRIPFVYSVRNRTTGLFYYGARWRKGCSPDDLWKTYFTSSSMVAKLISLYGKDDFDVYVIASFDSIEKARDTELLLLQSSKGSPLNINICRSTGLTDIEQSSRAGKIGGAIVKQTKVGICREMTVEERREQAALGGRRGGIVQRDTKVGIHGLTAEERRSNSSKAGRASLAQGKNLAHETGAWSEMGKKGGVRNRDTHFYNDGEREYKHRGEGIDEFLALNPQFVKGRIALKSTCPHCGVEGARAPMHRHHFDNCKTLTGKARTAFHSPQGSKTYNDGERSFRYTAAMQEAKSFSDFIAENPQFKPGLIRGARK